MTAESYSKSVFSFVRNWLLKWLYHFLFPPATNESLYCSASSPAFGVVSVLKFGHSNRCAVVSRCLISHFPDDIWCGTSFHMLICHLCIYFGEVSVKFFDLFFDWVVCFLIVELKKFFLYILDNRPFYQTCLLKYFLPACGLSSDILDHVFCREELLNFNEVVYSV